MTYAPTQIALVVSSPPTLGGYPWQNPIHSTLDGYRVVARCSAVGALVVSSSQDGTSWSHLSVTQSSGASTPSDLNFSSAFAPGATNGALYLFYTTGSGLHIVVNRIPYLGGGTWGTPVETTLVTSSYQQMFLCARFDSTSSTTDSEHTSGTSGLIHLAISDNSNPTGYLSVAAIDPNSSHTGGYKMLCKTAVAGQSSTIVNLIATNNKAYAIVTDTISGWRAYLLTFNGTTSYSVGTVENPGLPGDTACGLCLSSTSSNPNIYLFAVSSLAGTYVLNVQTRLASGGYSTVTSLGGGTYGLQAGSTAASLSLSTGDVEVVCTSYLSSSYHVYSAKRSAGVWGALARLDTAVTNENASGLDGWTFVAPAKLGSIGPALIYEILLTSDSNYYAYYDDGGWATSLHNPDPPTALKLTGTAGTFDTSNNGSPYYTSNPTFTLSAQYNTSNVSDPMTAYGLNVASWSSGKVLEGGVSNGGTFTMQYTGSALTKNVSTTVNCKSYGSSGMVSLSSSSVTVYYVSGTVASSLSPATLTLATVTFSCTYTQAESYACGSYQAQIITISSGAVILDTGVVLLGSSVATGGTLTLSTIDLSAVLANGSLVNGTSGVYGLRLTPLATNGGNAQWGTAQTFPLTLSVVGSPPPHDLSLTIPQDMPTSGGFIQGRYIQDSPSGGQTSAVSGTVYRRTRDPLGNTGTWVKIGTLPITTVGLQTFTDWSAGSNGVFGTQYDYQVTSTDARGIESLPSNVVTAGLPLVGIRLNDAVTPSTTVRLALWRSGDQLPEWETQQVVDAQVLFNRPAPSIDVGTQYSFHTRQELTLILDNGYQGALWQQLDAWSRTKDTVLLRDWRGMVFFAVVNYVHATSVGSPRRDGVVIDLQQVNAPQFTYLVTT